MLIVGITGAINHGKSTVSAALTDQIPASSRYFSSSQLVSSVANAMHKTTGSIPASDDLEAINLWLQPLPGILKELVHVDCTLSQIQITDQDVNKSPDQYVKLFSYLDKLRDNPVLIDQTVTELERESYRPFLQWLGGYLVSKVSPGIWYEEIIRQANQAKNYGAELCVIDGIRFRNDAKLIKDAGGIIVEITRPGMVARDSDDPTERERQSIKADVVILNNGSIEQLKLIAAQMLDDIRTRSYQKIYNADLV